MHIYFREADRCGVHHEKYTDRWFFIDDNCNCQIVDGVYVVDEDETKIRWKVPISSIKDHASIKPHIGDTSFVHLIQSPICLAETLTLEDAFKHYKKPFKYPIAYYTFKSGQIGFVFPDAVSTLRLFTADRSFDDPIEIPLSDLDDIAIPYDMGEILQSAFDAKTSPTMWDMLPLMDSSHYLGKMTSFKQCGHMIEVVYENLAGPEFVSEVFYYMWISGKHFAKVTASALFFKYSAKFLPLSNILDRMVTFCREHFICINGSYRKTWMDEPAHKFIHWYHNIQTNLQNESCDMQISCKLFNPYNVDESSFMQLIDDVRKSFDECEKRCQETIKSKGLMQKITARDLLP